MTEDNFNKLEEVYKRARHIRHMLSDISESLGALETFEEKLNAADYITVMLSVSGVQMSIRNIFGNREIASVLRANLKEKESVLTKELNALTV